jgi:hypothetical protein
MQSNLFKLNTFGTEEFVQFRQVLGLHRFKLHRDLVDVTVKSVWFKQVVWFTQGSVDVTVKSVWFKQVAWFTQGSVDVTVKSVWFTQGSVDVIVNSVWFKQVVGLLRVQ